MSSENLYIKSLKVENYKSLRNTKIDFRNGLNIIIGRNGAGKSNLLEFIYIQTIRGLDLSNPHISLSSNYSLRYEFFERNKKVNIDILVKKKRRNKTDRDANNSFDFSLVRIDGSKKLTRKFSMIEGTVSPPFSEKKLTMFRSLKKLLKTYIRFSFPEDLPWAERPSRFEINDDGQISFGESGWLFHLLIDLELDIEFDFLQTVPSKSRSSPSLLKKALIDFISKFLEKSAINPVLKIYSPIEGIRINPNINIYILDNVTIVENLSFDFLVQGSWVPWSFLSDGTKRLFYIITQILASDKDFLILIEEPELGIHPHQLIKLLEFIKEQSFERQIIISTHSPIVLDILNESELDRITIATYTDATRFSKLNKAQIAKARAYMSKVGDLSYYWLNSDLEV